MTEQGSLPSSFRDPSGFLYEKDQVLYRQINPAYAEDYEKLVDSGLYAALTKAKLLIPHEEVDVNLASTASAYKVIKPTHIDYISYPYEWCFNQLKDAALLTIKIQRIALQFDMVLKDASAYNIQFHNGAPIFIDTLSFTRYEEGKPWVAYKQYCQHFVAPLALAVKTDVRLSQLMRTNIDGIPLDTASRLLPLSSYFNFGLLSHIHLHARAQNKYSSSNPEQRTGEKESKIGHKAFSAFLQSLHSFTEKIRWKELQTEWGNYYSATNYDSQSMQCKEKLVAEYLSDLKDRISLVHDLGANNGHFSRIATGMGFRVVSQDIDPVAVEHNYALSKKERDKNMLPLLLDLTNPSPAIGWSLTERMSLIERLEGSTVMALALIHHLAISNNVPLQLVAQFFSLFSKHLIIEFVPKHDSQVSRLLSSRKDIFENYTQEEFEHAFSKHFDIAKVRNIEGSERTLYLMHRLSN